MSLYAWLLLYKCLLSDDCLKTHHSPLGSLSLHYFRPTVIHAKFSNSRWTASDTADFVNNRYVGWPILNQQGTTLFMEEVSVKTEKGVNWANCVFQKVECTLVKPGHSYSGC